MELPCLITNNSACCFFPLFDDTFFFMDCGNTEWGHLGMDMFCWPWMTPLQPAGRMLACCHGNLKRCNVIKKEKKTFHFCWNVYTIPVFPLQCCISILTTFLVVDVTLGGKIIKLVRPWLKKLNKGCAVKIWWQLQSYKLTLKELY